MRELEQGGGETRVDRVLSCLSVDRWIQRVLPGAGRTYATG